MALSLNKAKQSFPLLKNDSDMSSAFLNKNENYHVIKVRDRVEMKLKNTTHTHTHNVLTMNLEYIFQENSRKLNITLRERQNHCKYTKPSTYRNMYESTTCLWSLRSAD